MQKNKQIFIVSILLFLYFCGMIAVNSFKIDLVIVGVFRELLTIPAFILLAVLVVLSMISFVKQQFKPSGFPFLYIGHEPADNYIDHCVCILLISDHKFFFGRLLKRSMQVDRKNMEDGRFQLLKIVWLAEIITGPIIIHFIDRFLLA